MGPFLGVEGGGNHSHAIVIDGSGGLLGVGANHDAANWDDVGVSAAGAAIRACVLEALNRSALAPGDVEASVISIGGVDFPMDADRLSGIPAAIGLREPFAIKNDAFAALRAGTDDPYGVVVIASNGTVVAGRNPDGREFRSLGMGPVFGDSGSETDLSQAAVTAVALAYLDRGPKTALTQLFCEGSGVGSEIEFLEAASRGRIDPVGFAPTIIRAAEDGDAVARSLLIQAGETLGGTAVHTITMLGMTSMAFDLVLAGGMFLAGAMIADPLTACVRAIAPEVRVGVLRTPPVVGSALLAMELTGAVASPDVRVVLADQVAAALGGTLS
jgi:N-acetylglucosamine kinase-like BadF-type ATPase